MARIQILELPEGAGDERPPFVLVVDECEPQRIVLGMGGEAGTRKGDYWHEVASGIGARGVIVTPETIEIPANEVTLDDGQTMRLKIEGDFTAFREQAMREIAQAQADLRAGLR